MKTLGQIAYERHCELDGCSLHYSWHELGPFQRAPWQGAALAVELAVRAASSDALREHDTSARKARARRASPAFAAVHYRRDQACIA